jgi:hypothetical protein
MHQYILGIILMLYLTAYGVTSVFAGEQKPGEYQVKAAFIYNFINFVDWPPDSDFYRSHSINLCIFGDDPFGDGLDDLRNETVRGKKLAVKSCGSLDKLKTCHIVFIPTTEKKHVEQILKSVRNGNVLTVSDSEESARQGVIIGFFVERQRVRFAVNVEAARRAGIKISAKLLKLAKIVDYQED